MNNHTLNRYKKKKKKTGCDVLLISQTRTKAVLIVIIIIITKKIKQNEIARLVHSTQSKKKKSVQEVLAFIQV